MVIVCGVLTGLNKGAFFGCSNLTTITISDSVTNIGERAFAECSESLYIKEDGVIYVDNWAIDVVDKTIVSANIKPGTRGIASYAFGGCGSLTSVTIPSSVINIGKHAFRFCGSLANVTFNGTMTQWKSVKKGFDYLSYPYIVKCSDGEVLIYE